MRRRIVSFFALAALLSFPSFGAGAKIDPALLAGLKARSIGPAAMSGRIASIDSDPRNPSVIWVGSATGGVWKSESAGLTWEPVFDDQPVASIGAVAIDPTNSSVVWVGTGEGNPRNSVSIGEGLFKTLDGGKTWKRMGLEKTEHIHRIAIDPRNPQVAYVAALGKIWGENPERGVYKTTDGGVTWRRVLYVDERTGCADLVMDPSNPNKLFAAMWDYRRWPYKFRSGGPGSGLYVSKDGGENWQRLAEDDGLPKGELGRIGLAIARSNPKIVYALVEAKKPALLRSDDGGLSWDAVNTDPDVNDRPFYFADIRVDSADPNRLYRLEVTLDVSTDAGKTWKTLASAGAAHPDHHALWVDPVDPNHLIDGNDGGVFTSRDHGDTWSFAGGLPLSQLYHIRYDNDLPYHVYGGLQDNGSWRGPSSVWEGGDIRNLHWQEVDFGDGFDTAPDPRDSSRGYAMSQGGALIRWNLNTGERKSIQPVRAKDGPELRFNWNSALGLDPFDPDTIYYGSQFVHKSTDRGETWTVISPDLTTNRAEWQPKETGGVTQDVTGAENYTTLLAIEPSPKAKDLLWVGSDDGRLQITRNGGKDWTSVEGNVHGVPANTWIPHIHASTYDPATAFVVFDDHRRANYATYVYRTDDYGKTWKSLATPDLRGYALAITQDPVAPNLLFLGTEFGLWFSLDGGGKWYPFRHGVPTVSVMDLAIQPRDRDLLIATHGRGIYILDDLEPLRELTAAALAEPLHLFPIGDAQQSWASRSTGPRFPGGNDYKGKNKGYGAALTFVVNGPDLPHPDATVERERKEAKRKADAAAQEGQKPDEASAAGAANPANTANTDGDKKAKVQIQIRNAAGERIRSFEQSVTLGINRVAWDLRGDAFKEPPTKKPPSPFRPGGPQVVPGTYTVKITYGDKTAEGQVRVLADPRFHLSDADRAANNAAVRRAGALKERVSLAAERIGRTKSDIKAILDRVNKRDDERRRKDGTTEKSPEVKALEKAARELRQKLDAVERKLWKSDEVVGRPKSDDLLSELDDLLSGLGSSWDAPNATQQRALEEEEEKAAPIFAELDGLYAKEVPAFRAMVPAGDLELLGGRE